MDWKCGIIVAILTFLIYILLRWCMDSISGRNTDEEGNLEGPKSMREITNGSAGEYLASFEVLAFISIFIAYQVNISLFGCGKKC